MNVVVQNGCEHILSRKDVESLLDVLPNELTRRVKAVTLYQGVKPELFFEYFEKDETLGFFCPRSHEEFTKQLALELLVAALICIQNRGELPERLSKNRKEEYRNDARHLMESLA